jgi:hypothetical protein
MINKFLMSFIMSLDHKLKFLLQKILKTIN